MQDALKKIEADYNRSSQVMKQDINPIAKVDFINCVYLPGIVFELMLSLLDCEHS
jgi:hypothetical protein